jgi:hypothetical protein
MFDDEMPMPVRLVSPITELPPQHPAMMGSLAPASVVGQRDLRGEFRGEGMSGVYMSGGTLPVFERLRRGLPAKEEWYEFALMDNAKRAREYEDMARRQFMVEVAKQRFEEENAFRPIGRRKGKGFFDNIAKAFDPNRNGVARAFQPKNIAKAFDPVAKAFDPNRNGIKRGVEKIIKDTGAEKFITKTLPSTLIHQGIPAVAGFLGSKIGLGEQARQLGEMGAKEVSKVSGMGFKKGSPEAKAHMAKLRAMRKKKISGGTAFSVGFVGNQQEYKPTPMTASQQRETDIFLKNKAKEMGATPEQIAMYKTSRTRR